MGESQVHVLQLVATFVLISRFDQGLSQKLGKGSMLVHYIPTSTSLSTLLLVVGVVA